MRASYHFAATTVISAAVYLATKSTACFALSFASGTLLDIDHIFDYFLQQGINFRVRYFFSWCYEIKSTHMLLMFHSLELFLALWVLVFLFRPPLCWVALGIGFSQHMALDIIFNRDIVKVPHFYFFTLRFIKGFRLRDFLQPAYLPKE